GRNWEGFGADPFLSGVATAATITGIQSNGVIATVKSSVFCVVRIVGVVRTVVG
ncbi:hypothetical protein B0H13DRAFT_1661044, partial [Mycena leptocephala]